MIDVVHESVTPANGAATEPALAPGANDVAHEDVGREVKADADMTGTCSLPAGVTPPYPPLRRSPRAAPCINLR